MSSKSRKGPDDRYTYDEIPYTNFPYQQSHPDRLATLGTLFGMSPKPIDRCRVLEIGCASGGNLVPMAYGLPHSQFLGIDLSEQQIAEGQKLGDALGLKNLTLRHLDLSDIPPSLGKFDYIIAHGVYSWVTPPVQEKLLQMYRRHLGPQGVGYISYNTYPGWHFRGMIRDMMLYHTKQFSDPASQAAQARALLDFLAQWVPKDTAYASMLRAEVDVLRDLPDSYLLHDHLEQANEPVYFYQFAERAVHAGLKYLAEAELSTMLTWNFPDDVAETLLRISNDLMRTEQYMDFLRNRPFRQTLLCQQDTVLRRELVPEVIESFAIASSARPLEELKLDSEDAAAFQTHANTTFTVKNDVGKAAFAALGEAWPRAHRFEELCTTVSDRLGRRLDRPARHGLGADLLKAYGGNLVELYTREPVFIVKVAEAPRASLLAREQAKRSRRVTNLRHEAVNLDEFSRRLLMLLDGHRDRPQLVQGLTADVQNGDLKVHQENNEITDPGALGPILTLAIEKMLPTLATNALLES